MTRLSRPFIAVAASASLSLIGTTLGAGPAAAHPRPATPVVASVPSEPGVSSQAMALLELLNAERGAAGLDAMTLDAHLSDLASRWSSAMAERSVLAHNPSLRTLISEAVPGWQGLAENVGVGSGAAVVHGAFMDSSGHRRNILGDYNRVGIGVHEAAGRTWVTVDFLRS